MNDWELIQAYSQNQSEEAFETLVKRHVDFVYCSALRQVSNSQLAEDVCQAVFLLLSRKAAGFKAGTVVVSWLFRTTQFIASRALRSEQRRRRREAEAFLMNPLNSTSAADQSWERVAPLLDEAIAALPEKDREVVLLRFMSRKPFAQVAGELGLSEDAAKKRVERSLTRLRKFFGHRGVAVTTTTALAFLADRAVQAAPPVIASKIVAGVTAGAGGAASTVVAALAQAAARHFFWIKVRNGIGAALVISGILFTTVQLLKPAQKNAATMDGTAVAQNLEAPRTSESGPVSPSNELTTARNRGRRISLLVAAAEDRQPIKGVQVLVNVWRENHSDVLQESQTDEQGALDIPVPAQFDVLHVWVSGAGRVPKIVKWNDHEFTDTVTPYTIFLEKGRREEGQVIDESGRPVAGAKVYFRGPGLDVTKRENRHFHPKLSAVLTDAKGYWATEQLPPEEAKLGVGIGVAHPDFVLVEDMTSSFPGFPTNLIITLSNGVALSGRVIGPDSNPVANARVSKREGAYLSARTDQDGRFAWSHVESSRTWLEVEADGFEQTRQAVEATNLENEVVVTLGKQVDPTLKSEPRRVHLHGKVVDAQTGLPVPRFEVLVGRQIYVLPQPVLEGGEHLGEGVDGRFDWPNVRRWGAFNLIVKAEGYLQAVSELRPLDAAEDEFSFELQRAGILSGTVLSPDGEPAVNAVITLMGPGYGGVMQAPGVLLEANPGFNDTRTRTDQQGRFQLSSKDGMRGVICVHASGCAVLTVSAATNGSVVLQPWGGISGTLFVSGKPASHQRISVTGDQRVSEGTRGGLSFTYRTETDDQGKFDFRYVPSGNHFVAREVGYFGDMPSLTFYSHGVAVKVSAGETTSVDLRREGRTVSGRITFKGSQSEIAWGTSKATLSSAEYSDSMGFSDGQDFTTVFLRQTQNVFPFFLSKDGNIRADDIPPGTYRLSIELAREELEPMGLEKPFAKLQTQVTIPAGDDSTSFDLGQLKVPKAE